MAQYLYQNSGVTNGPFAMEEMLRLLERGVIPQTALARREDSGEWQVVGSFPEFKRDTIASGAKSRTSFVLLAVFLGGLGIHNFYAGYTTRGVVQLFLGILVIPLLAVWVWSLVEAFTVTQDASGSDFV